MKEQGTLSKWIMAGLMAIVILAPTQHGLALTKKIHLSLVDPVVWVTFGLWLVDQVRTGAWKKPGVPLVMPVLFVALAALSLAKAPNLLGSAHKVLQQAEYFIAAYLLFATAFADPKRLRQGVDAFLAVATVVVLIGFVQYAIPGIPNFQVRGTFGNSNVFGGFLSLALPLMFGLMLGEPDRLRRTWLFIIILAGVTAVLSGGSFLALAFALGCVAMGRGWKTFLAYAAAFLLIAFLALPHLPRRNLEVQRTSVELFNDDGDVNRRYLEWQAAASMTREHPLMGVGLGLYQENMGQFYGLNAPVGGTAAQPDSQNLYLVLASSIGIPGLIVFLGLLLGAGAAAARKAAAAADAATRGLYLGVAGSVIAFAVNSLWSPLLVRGIGIPLVFILALANSRFKIPDSKTAEP